MIRIICPQCKKEYLEKADDKFICPSCKAELSAQEENLLCAAQYYGEGDFTSAKDYLMKYIVKNGAEPRAIIYKALCDGFDFDEDTISLRDTYEKILQALTEIDSKDFPCYLALANDEAQKIEKALADKHINLFADADAEKIKKEVTAIIGIQNDAKDFRTGLSALAERFNQQATDIQLSLKLSKCFLVEPEIATEVGQKKYDKILENIASHTVFTGILSTEIKNLEIYYRCIVMFFERNRQKYDFLMASAEKFAELSKVLEEGRYNTIKGTSTIGDKLKSAAYDFFQESLKDHDGEFETQEETVAIIDIAPQVTQEEEAPVMEDISSNTLDSETIEQAQAEQTEEIEPTEAEGAEVADSEEEIIEATEEASQEAAEDAEDVESEEPCEIEETVVIDAVSAEEAVIEVEPAAQETEPFEADENTESTEEVEEAEETVITDSAEATEPADDATQVIEITQDAPLQDKFEKIDDVEEIGEPITEPAEEPVAEIPKKARKTSYAPIITGLVIIFGILAIIGFAVVPDKLNQANYEKAKALQTEKKYSEAAAIFEDLKDYEDAAEQALQCKYDYAASLEAKKEYELAKDIYKSLADFKDSKAKVESCYYNFALQLLDNGDYDNAIAVFVSIPDYADSKARIDECNYQKALKLLSAKDYEGAIDIFSSMEDYSDSKARINEAKYAYVKANYSKDNSTTVAFLTDLVKAKYKDSVDVRNKLLGTADEAKNGVSHSISYSETATDENLKEAQNTKPIYFHITVTEKKHYDKRLTVQYKTSMGYTEKKSIVLTADKNTYALLYPNTPSENYTVEFKLLGSDNATLATQTITIK